MTAAQHPHDPRVKTDAKTHRTPSRPLSPSPRKRGEVKAVQDGDCRTCAGSVRRL